MTIFDLFQTNCKMTSSWGSFEAEAKILLWHYTIPMVVTLYKIAAQYPQLLRFE